MPCGTQAAASAKIGIAISTPTECDPDVQADAEAAVTASRSAAKGHDRIGALTALVVIGTVAAIRCGPEPLEFQAPDRRAPSLEDVPIGEEAELIVRGPNLMQGYHNKPAETASALRKGWYHTGDLAKSELLPVI